MRRVIPIALSLATSASPLVSCMSSRFIMTDYDERTEDQWLQAFLIDMGVGAALIGTSFLVGSDGNPEPWTLSAGALSAGVAFLIMPLASYPPAPTK